MTVPTQNTLLALLLALSDLETPLRIEEQSALCDTAAQLALNPNTWESFIAPNLLTVVQANSSLNQLYQAALSQLNAVGGNIPRNLLPTKTELAQVVPAASEVVTRGFVPVSNNADSDSQEINNMAINILATPNPPATAKKLNRFAQLKQFLQQPLAEK